jgi:AraC family transcriptional regulator, transcriptional activator of pobA
MHNFASMEKIETIEEFYQRKFNWIPDNIKSEIGHFNVFHHEPIEPGKIKPLPYKRRDFYKIMLVVGDINMNYADRVVSVKKQALFFSNPQIPYNCENLERIEKGFYCIFNQHFFHKFGDLNQYSVFQPSGNHVFELSDEQVDQVTVIYKKMFEEIQSDYVHKYDVLRNLVFELLHFAMKIQPAANIDKQLLNASRRISTLFLELLERQFPVDENHQKINLRSASDFAGQLNVHVNHLNRSLKETTNKTTSQIIIERVLQESKILLKHSKWNVSEIAYALGFTEVTHFNNFFKKHVQISPLKYRNA